MSIAQAERRTISDYGWPNADPSYRYSWPLPEHRNVRVVNLERTLLGPGSFAGDSVLKWKSGTDRAAQWVYLPTNLLQGIHQSDDERFVLYIRVEHDNPLSTVFVNVTVTEPQMRLWKNFKAIAEWTRDDVSRCIAEYSRALLELGTKTGAGVTQRQDAI